MKNESDQPQLPPRPERVTDESGFYTLYQADEADAHMNALEAENESLKAQLAQWEQSYKSAVKGRQDFRSAMKLARKHQAVAEAERDKYKNEANQLRLAFVLSDAILPAEFEPTLPPTKRLHVYINKALEVIREYRDNASGHGCNCEYFKDDTCEDDTRCPTCIKADALLTREEK